MEGAVIRNKPVSETDFSGNSDEVARRHTLEAINHQNWSTMSNLMIIANSFMFDFSKDYYHNTEMLDRYIKLLDFTKEHRIIRVAGAILLPVKTRANGSEYRLTVQVNV